MELYERMGKVSDFSLEFGNYFLAVV